MNGPLITVDQLATGFVLFVVALLLAAVVDMARNGLVGAMDRLDERRRLQAERDAATFGEPTREQVEAQVDADAAWLALMRAVDGDALGVPWSFYLEAVARPLPDFRAPADADAAWAALLRAVDATTDDVRTAYAARNTTHP